jgi:hypothetical protein
VSLSYQEDGESLEKVLCYLPLAPWPPQAIDAAFYDRFTPAAFVDLFGLRWSSAELREKLEPLGFQQMLPEVRSEHSAELRRQFGLELNFASSEQLRRGDPQHPRSLGFAGVTFYASRELDAREWVGALPQGLQFADTQEQMFAKVGHEPVERAEEDFSGTVVWHLDQYALVVVHSLVENRLLRISLMDLGLWDEID